MRWTHLVSGDILHSCPQLRIGHKEENMVTTALRMKVIEEIQQMPEDKLGELYDVLHFFRIGIQHTPVMAQKSAVMDFAGCWNDMADDEFDAFLGDIALRRQQASSGRPSRETLAR